MAMAMVVRLVALAVHAMLLMPMAGVAATFGGGFQCPTAFWIFGDSLSDTGNSQAVLPTANRLYPPYGSSYTFCDKPGFNRNSDGRLVVDFVAQAFSYPFFGTYSHALNGANYLRGANFAYSASFANSTSFVSPFYLLLQVDQYLNFKEKALFNYPSSSTCNLVDAQLSKGLLNTPVPDAFTKGAVFILEIGGNDFLFALGVLNVPPQGVIADFVPAAAAAVKQAIITLHASGERLFFLGNTPPLGCSPLTLTLFSNLPKDSLGCVDDINAISRAYGAALQTVVNDLRTSFAGDGTQIYYIDNYNATIEILTNPTTYGKLAELNLLTHSFTRS